MADFDPFINHIVNNVGPALVAYKAYGRGMMKFIQVSTYYDYGFIYDNVFKEDDVPSPKFAYVERALPCWKDRHH